jgi:aminoglycoside phosphotransferase (APT) family kinase protein
VALLRVLEACALPAAVPGLLSDAALREPLGRCHVALRRVPGEPAGPARVAAPAALATAAGDLARLLSRLAELGTAAAVRAAVPRNDHRVWERFARDVAQVLFPLMSAAGRARAEAELAGVLAVSPAGDALVHGDLGDTNLLWHAGPRLAGVLDWDEAHLGNQASDLASIGASLGWPLAASVDALRHAGGTPMLGDARAIAATFALQQALPAARSGDTVSLDDGLSGYRGPAPAS